MSPISRMWSAEKAVVGRQWRRNSWCGHNWVTGFVCNLHTSSPSHLSPSLLSPFCHGGDVAFVMGRGWQLSCTSVSLPLSQPSLLGKCLSLAQLQRSCSTARDTFFVTYSTCWRCAFEVIVTVIWMELKCGCVWLILMHLRWIPLPA